MKTFIIVILCLIIGGAVGGFLALGYGAGMGAVGGMLLGSQAGTCLAVETAKEQNLLTPEEVDQTITATVGKIKAGVNVPADSELKWVASDADCANMIGELKKALADAAPQTAQ
jgi:hypothetical protein